MTDDVLLNQRLSRPILESIITERLSDFTEFTRVILGLDPPPSSTEPD